MIRTFIILLMLAVLTDLTLADELPSAPVCDLGDLATLTNWSGLQATTDGAHLALPGEAAFSYPSVKASTEPAAAASPDAKRDWYRWYGVRFDVKLDDDRAIALDVALNPPANEKDKAAAIAKTTLKGAGWHTVSLPWSTFDFPQTFSGFLHDINAMKISARFEDGQPGGVELRKPQLIRAEKIWLDAGIYGKSAGPGGTVTYDVTVGNCTDGPQAITLSFQTTGFEAMAATVEPASLQLAQGATGKATVKVNVPTRIPPGGQETQTLRAISNGAGSPSQTLTFVTASRVGYPNILLTADGWQEVREKVNKYDWAMAAQKEYVTQAEKWEVPQVAKNTGWLFPTRVEYDLMAAGTAYQLTGEKRFAEKVRSFLLNLSNPQDGYPLTRRACNQASVQEGEFFQHVAMAYDMAIPSGVFTDADRQQIDQTLRLFCGEPTFDGNISNWAVSYQCGQLYCALVLQDLSLANRMLYSPGALIDQFVQGTLDDGWWYEVSISYNTWVATEFSQVAIAMRPWGMDLANMSFPGAYRPDNVKPPQDEEYGMSRARWGPIYHNSLNIKRMWDALPPMVDWHGVIFGLNDSGEKPIVGSQMDIAYYLYRDPAYATLIKRGGGKRDLLYGVPDLPENTPDLSFTSTYADNAGLAVLRSQTPDRPARERIQAVLRYGDHGWYHGHFDATDLLHLSRYGRSFYNPESVWYSYPNYMYKFYVQTSLAHNMVIVDQKQQEPTESQRLLFHSGPMMQVAAVQTKARWSNPPYGGMVYVDQTKSFPDKAFGEGRSVPILDNPPPYGAVTGYTEPVLQRRVLVVTDDYVVVADYCKGDREHTFDQVFQMKGFQGLEGTGKTLARHTGQWNPDPLSSAQFVTDCDWYDVQAPARSSYRFQWGTPGDKSGGAIEQNINGVLNIDLHTLWPPRHQIMIGTRPETQPVNRQVHYSVRGDGKTLSEGKSGMWILGEVNLDIPLQGEKTLELQTQTSSTNPGTLFWAGGSIITTDGKEIPLSQFPVRFDNTMQPKEPGKDFAGGPIKIAGISYDSAISAQPQDGKNPAVVKVDLSGMSAARFKCVLGGDYPVGDEADRRKTVAISSTGKEASFLTVMEPFEDKRMITKAAATSPDGLRVELADGRVQEITFDGLSTSGQEVNVQITETRADGSTRTEYTRSNRE